MCGRNIKFRPRIDHGNANQAIFPDDVLLGETGGLEHDRGRVVEHLEVARIIDDVGGVAVAPLDLHIAPVHEHGLPNPDSATTAVSPLSRWERVGVRGYAIPDRP